MMEKTGTDLHCINIQSFFFQIFLKCSPLDDIKRFYPFLWQRKLYIHVFINLQNYIMVSIHVHV